MRFRFGQVLARSCRLGFAERQQYPLGRRSFGLEYPPGIPTCGIERNRMPTQAAI